MTEKDSGAFRVSHEMRSLISLALFEDIGTGDVTSVATLPENLRGAGRLFSKAEGILCGMEVAQAVLELVDRRVKMDVRLGDGSPLSPGKEIARIEGPYRSILMAERLLLNFVQHLSGVATLTAAYVNALRAKGGKAQVVDTRKTTPLWRRFEKYAVRVGGGGNHRFALYDMYLVKNNHVDAAGGMETALKRVQEHNEEPALPVAVEARNLDEVRAILSKGADLILLDNMSIPQIEQALQVIDGQIQVEITGGVTLDNIGDYAHLAVDRISVGALTHSAPALDISLHVEKEGDGA